MQEQDEIQQSVEHDVDSADMATPSPMSQHIPFPSYTHASTSRNTQGRYSTSQHQDEMHDALYEEAPMGPAPGGPEDSSTLFVSERSPSEQRATQRAHTARPKTPARLPSTHTHLPMHARPANPVLKIGVFHKIRSMQASVQKKRDLALKRTPAHPTNIDPDNETYLDAVLQNRLPVVTGGAPSVDEDIMSDRQALAEYQKKKRYYDDLRRNSGSGQLSFRHDVEWLQIQGAERARRMKRDRDLALASEDGGEHGQVFPQVRSMLQMHGEPEEEEASDHDFDFGRPGPRKRVRRDGPGKPISMIDAELQSMQVGMEAHEETAGRKKKKGKGPDDSPATSSRGKTKNRNRNRPSRAKGAIRGGHGKTAKDKRELERAALEASSLFNSNIFAQQAGPDASEQPCFTSRNKQSGLKELIASVPLGNLKKAKNEMNMLLTATRAFNGHGSVKPMPENSLWSVKGMKTTLKHYQILGTAFMRRRETSAEEPRGGLLADQMGLGKTLMMLGK